MSGILPTRGHMIDFLVNLAPNLNPKTHQKSNQEAPKIDKKGYSKHDASWLRIWNPLGTDLGGFWVQVGGQVGAKLAPKSIKMESKMTSKKEVELKRGDSLFGGDHGGLGAPWEGDLGGGKNRSLEGSRISRHANGPKARRIFISFIQENRMLCLWLPNHQRLCFQNRSHIDHRTMLKRWSKTASKKIMQEHAGLCDCRGGGSL